MSRTPEALVALVMGIDVVNNFAFIPHRRAIANGSGGFDPTQLLTLCNAYVTCCTAGLGCAVPPMKANSQYAWLGSAGGQVAGWTPVDAETARQRAQLGRPTVAALANPLGHGHIALVVPADPAGPPGVYVSSAGVVNHVRTPLARSFGTFTPQYWTHE